MLKHWRKRTAMVAAAAILAGTIGSAGGAPAASAATAVAGTPYNDAGQYDVTVPHVVINQVYGAGLVSASDAWVSHGFIELYNPTSATVDLTGWSLQYADRGTTAPTGSTKEWEKLNLAGAIPAGGYFVIAGKATGAATPVVDLTGRVDLTWDRYINNKGLKVALLSNQTLLTDVNPFDIDAAHHKAPGYVDMVGTGSNDDQSTIDGYETAYPTGSAQGTSKKKAIRRKVKDNVDGQDFDNNQSDFKQIDYSSSSLNLAADGPHLKPIVQPLELRTSALSAAYVGSPYSATIAVYGGTAPFTFAAEGLPEGLKLDAVKGKITGIPQAAGESTVKLSVKDAVYPTSKEVSASVTLRVNESTTGTIFKNGIEVTKLGGFIADKPNDDGGVAEIVKYNKDNGKFYLVDGAGDPPSLKIVELGNGTNPKQTGEVEVKDLAETNGFVYGDLTSVDINSAAKRIAVSVQEEDGMKPGKILTLDYDGKLLATYETGVQPDMIKSTKDGRYILTADEGEPRTAGNDPEGSITIVDTQTGTVKHVKFDDPSVIADDVHIRGAADPATKQITGSGTKADAVRDLEPEYIALSSDEGTAYVTLQENNAVAAIDIVKGKVTWVKGLGLKNLNDPANQLDLVKDGVIQLENVPFYGVYMPDGVASFQAGGKTYLVTGNEGDATEWEDRLTASTVKAMKGSLDPDSAAAKFLKGTTRYDSVEVMSDMGNGGIYLYGGRSFSIWDASTMKQVSDTGSDFERITAQRYPNNFNASNSSSKTGIDERSGKKGPEPEDVKTGTVGTKTLAFAGLERIGGVMTYDVTDPAKPQFLNYTNTRNFSAGANDNTDSAPEGLEFIPAADSPTGYPLLLVANEVGGTVSILQLNVSKIALDRSNLSLTAGGSVGSLTATATAADGSATTVAWTSSNPAVATVDSQGRVTPVSTGTAVIAAVTADGYAKAEAVVTVTSAGGPYVPTTPSPSPSPTPTPTPSGQTETYGDVTVNLNGNAAVIKLSGESAGDGSQTLVELPAEAVAKLTSGAIKTLTVETGAATLSFDADAIAAIGSAAGKGALKLEVRKLTGADAASSLPESARGGLQAAVGDRPVIELKLSADGKSLHQFGSGKVKIELPYVKPANEDVSGIVVRYIADDGRIETLPGGVYDAASGTLRFSVSHFSMYGVGYENRSFADTAGSFAVNDIAYLAARGILDGVGQNVFAPKRSVTRADLTVMLARIAGADLAAYQGKASGFNDVKSGDYFAGAVAWAVDSGIVSGTSAGRFDPRAALPRADLAVMLVKFAAAQGIALPSAQASATFTDAAAIPAYASQAVEVVQRAGIVSGRPAAGGAGLAFAPKSTATREELAKMLAAFVKLSV
ncbi:S-layer homology domain-containing protein [Cohnella sp. OV330]|uniref:choice-of-anchor I family protein n=1 Tax=Cohnella sp. OV330 TaxID=1855288 RepID=UPI0008E78A35|nr:choice-of-anchor I family protein [Cohnella sp. OV330]SFA96740.1 S-layer homology domain-containing protein [Cohnella sp. OV330]